MGKKRSPGGGGGGVDDLPTPGTELRELCANARQVVELCDALGFEFRGGRHYVGLLEGAHHTGVSLDELIEDPDLRPYIWEIED